MSAPIWLEELRARSDPKYAAFQAKLTPTIDPESVLGVRMPVLRAYAKEFAKTAEKDLFLNKLPHEYYDENLLHGILLSMEKNFDACLEGVKRFLPYVDNWAVCDTMSPKAFAKNKTKLLPVVREWIASPEVYTCRFGIGMLMTHWLDADFAPQLLELPAAVRSEEYYVRMMVAWYFATALAKQWDAAIPYLTERRLDEWTHRKTIQKAVESYRITEEQKAFLRTLR